MIKKLTDELFLYNGDVLSRGDLEREILNLQEQIATIQQDANSIELIEIIPEISSNRLYLDAANRFNESQSSVKEDMFLQIDILTSELETLKNVINADL